MLPDRVSNPGPLTYESGALPIALRGPARAMPSADSSCFFFFVFFVVCLRDNLSYIWTKCWTSRPSEPSVSRALSCFANF